MAVSLVSTGVTFPDGSTQTTRAAQVPAFTNRIINGAMVIDQRNAGASVNTSTANAVTYTLDRWAYLVAVASKFTIQQNAGSVTPPSGFTNYLGCTSSSAYSVGANEYFLLEQIIEGNNVADLAWGTANAQSVTLSFWVRSSLTGTFGGSLQNNDSTRSYPFTYTISSANTWTAISVNISGPTTGTWLTNNSAGIRIYFGLGAGSTYSGTAGSWASANYIAATGATSVVGTNGATFYITGVQLEKGSTATSFDYRPYGTELALCQRYYQQVGGYSTSDVGIWGYITGSGTIGTTAHLPVGMRANPTVAKVGTWNVLNVGQPLANGIGNLSFTWYAPGTVVGAAFCLSTTSAYFTASAEL